VKPSERSFAAKPSRAVRRRGDARSRIFSLPGSEGFLPGVKEISGLFFPLTFFFIREGFALPIAILFYYFKNISSRKDPVILKNLHLKDE
jgi:hypothetical protein